MCFERVTCVNGSEKVYGLCKNATNKLQASCMMSNAPAYFMDLMNRIFREFLHGFFENSKPNWENIMQTSFGRTLG